MVDVEKWRNEIKRIADGIREHASDTVCISDYQTACDALDDLYDEMSSENTTGELFKS